MNVAEVLEASADRIEKYGLHKHWYYKADREMEVNPQIVGFEPPEGPCCTLGAMYAVVDDWLPMQDLDFGEVYQESKDFDAARSYLANRLAQHNAWGDTIPEWNDTRSQRKGRVVAKLRAVAAEWRKENESE